MCCWRCVEIGPRRHICLCPGPAQLPAVIKNGARRDDTELFYCSLQASDAALPSRLVGGGRTLKQATTALTNKANKDGGRGGAGKGQLWAGVVGVKACQRRLNCHARWTVFVG